MSEEVLNDLSVTNVTTIESERMPSAHAVEVPDYDKEYFDDVPSMTSMLLVLLGNYRGSCHFGGPLAYTPFNGAVHLGGPELGGLSYDIREPKHPFADRFMLAGGHCIPTC